MYRYMYRQQGGSAVWNAGYKVARRVEVRVVLVRARCTARDDIGPAIGIGLKVGNTTVRVMLKKDTSFSNQDNLQSAS